MASSQPLIYAELLSNIRQVSVIAALDAPCDLTTRAGLSAEGRQIVLTYHGETHILDLPGQVNPNAHLQKPVLGSKELSWRLPLLDQSTRESREDSQSCDAPWSAGALGENEEFMCRSCGAVILKRGSIKTWKDLPSENWAEMMDFWHCHKPDIVEEDEDLGHNHDSQRVSHETLAERGYGANTKFAARPGLCFVDITTFLVSENDCINITSIDTAKSDQVSRITLLA